LDELNPNQKDLPPIDNNAKYTSQATFQQIGVGGTHLLKGAYWSICEKFHEEVLVAIANDKQRTAESDLVLPFLSEGYEVGT
jgi:hypothetical protein